MPQQTLERIKMKYSIESTLMVNRLDIHIEGINISTAHKIKDILDNDLLGCVSKDYRLRPSLSPQEYINNAEARANINTFHINHGYNRISTIKYIRQFTGLGLKEAKDVADAIVEYRG